MTRRFWLACAAALFALATTIVLMYVYIQCVGGRVDGAWLL